MLEPDRKPSSRRSPEWAHVRAAHLRAFPKCALCGRRESVEVHHKKPFHLFPELELDASNLITLCDRRGSGLNCHRIFGHLGSWRSWNENVDEDVAQWRAKMAARPKT